MPPLPVADPAEKRQHDEPLESPQVKPPRAVPAARRGGGGRRGRRRAATNARCERAFARGRDFGFETKSWPLKILLTRLKISDCIGQSQ